MVHRRRKGEQRNVYPNHSVCTQSGKSNKVTNRKHSIQREIVKNAETASQKTSLSFKPKHKSVGPYRAFDKDLHRRPEQSKSERVTTRDPVKRGLQSLLNKNYLDPFVLRRS